LAPAFFFLQQQIRLVKSIEYVFEEGTDALRQTELAPSNALSVVYDLFVVHQIHP